MPLRCGTETPSLRMEKLKDSGRLVFMAWELWGRFATGLIQGQSLPRQHSQSDTIPNMSLQSAPLLAGRTVRRVRGTAAAYSNLHTEMRQDGLFTNWFLQRQRRSFDDACKSGRTHERF